MRSSRRSPLHLIAFAAAAFLVGSAQGDERPRGQPAVAERFAVAADHPLASEAGMEVLRAGGSAADAAAAVMLTLGVVNPASSGLGGGGFALYYRASDRSLTFLDFRESAPLAITPDMFRTPESSTVGGLATAVPGEPAGIDALLHRFGSLRRSQVVEPALRHARDGFVVHRILAERSSGEEPRRDGLIGTWFAEGATSLTVGQRIQNVLLARTLTTFARRGARLFYRGAIAQAIVSANRRAGGVMTAPDLARYRVIEREPISRERFGYRWSTAPLPSAGGYTMLASLALLERWAAEAPLEAQDGSLFHAFVESWKGPTLDRASFSDDQVVTLDQLLAEPRLQTVASKFQRDRAVEATQYAPPPNERGTLLSGGSGTSHLCVVDGEGNIAAVTTSINLAFGAGYTAAGMVMNDQMDDFATRATDSGEGTPNQPRGGRRPISNMAPTIVFKDDRPVLCIGGSGGARIPSAVEQVAYHVLVRGVSPAQALLRPRVQYAAAADTVRTDTFAPLQESVTTALRSRGHRLEPDLPLGSAVQLIRIRDSSPRLVAASDPRKGGVARGE